MVKNTFADEDELFLSGSEETDIFFETPSESVHGNQNSIYSWNNIFDELSESFLKRKKTVFKIEHTENKRQKTDSTKDLLLDNLPSSVDGSNADNAKETDYILTNYSKPVIKRHGLTKKQIEGLTITRFKLFQYFFEVGESYRKKRNLLKLDKISDQDPKDVQTISGHHIAATIYMLDIPLTAEDIELVISLTSSGNLTVEINREKMFIDSFNMICKLTNVDGLNKIRLNKTEYKNNIFFCTSCTPIYNSLITWTSWCKGFEELKLKVQKNGLVW